MNKIVDTKKAPKALGPYSQAIINNGLVYTSGQIAIDPDTQEFVNGNIGEQTELVLKNLGEILLESGSNLTNTVKVNIYLKCIDDFNVVNKIYSKYFTNTPSRSTVEVSSLPKGALIEIDCIAYI